MIGPVNMIIPTGVKTNGTDVFAILDPDSGGNKTFSAALSADGLAPATYWGARTYLEDATYNALKNMTVTQFKAYVDQVSAQRGRTPVGSVTAFKNSLLMDDTLGFYAFATANGLKPVQQTI